MRKRMEKAIRNLRGKSIVTQIIFFILSLCVSACLVGGLIIAMISLIIAARYTGLFGVTNDAIEEINAQMKDGVTEEACLLAIQERESYPLAISIVDQNDRLVAFYGQEIDPEEDLILEGVGLEDIDITFLRNKDKDNPLVICTLEIIEACLSPENSPVTMREKERYLSHPLYTKEYWFEERLASGQKAYIKNRVIFYGLDFVEILAFSLLLGINAVIATIVRFIRVIAGIITQRYYSNLILTDPVTGGHNEFAFEFLAFKNIVSYWEKKRGFAVISTSVLKYQNYCTLYGVEAGERLLRAFYYAIVFQLKKGEVISRTTDGNFQILIKTNKEITDEEGLIRRAEQIIENALQKVSDCNNRSGKILGIESIHVKSGVYYLPPVTDADSARRRNKDELNIKNLCIKAEMAKNASGDESGMTVYNHEMWEKEIWERKVENMMKEALEREEFQVYIQPKYHPATEELMGGEALVRWISPTEGFISPGQFIPIFERNGFIVRLDDYMISHTAKLQAEWLAEGKKIVPISVNVSRAHFAKPDLAEHIRDLVDEYPLPHKYIEIELTESAFFDDKKMLLTTVKRLQEYGFEVSMDDFGSGYSSLNSLKDLPLNVLKLDAEFFRGEDFDGRGEIVVSEAIALAKQLNMRIVAEGVEKKEQVDFLASQDCDMIQGYYFAKPMPAAEYEDRMK